MGSGVPSALDAVSGAVENKFPRRYLKCDILRACCSRRHGALGSTASLAMSTPEHEFVVFRNLGSCESDYSLYLSGLNNLDEPWL
ncbi:hypothetical protein Sjap_000215 [Stephania japonica]|uniref:Uncharacterized protein n=1 Tax=Stephania japonica TaxID=461633 RepID=A0AAP0KIJ9_9MAGN